MKILLVEDDRKIGQFVKKGLEEVACVTVWARSRKEAREAGAKTILTSSSSTSDCRTAVACNC